MSKKMSLGNNQGTCQPFDVSNVSIFGYFEQPDLYELLE